MSNDLFERELTSLLNSDSPPPAPRGEARGRLLSELAWLERFTPLAPLVASTLSVAPGEARLALHALSEPGGWVTIETLDNLKIRPVKVRSRAGEREIDGAMFAQVDPGAGIPRHQHHGAETMIVLQGCLRDRERPDLPPWLEGATLSSEDNTEHTLWVPPDPRIACLCLVFNQGWVEYL